MQTFDEWVAEVRAVNPDIYIDPSLRSRFDDPEGYKGRHRTQMVSWAMGRPYHNRQDDECCPDFSCCYPDMFEDDAARRWERYRLKYGNQ